MWLISRDWSPRTIRMLTAKNQKWYLSQKKWYLSHSALWAGRVSGGTEVSSHAVVMNNLKTARRSLMGNLLLRTLMTICELGKEWEDPCKIPVDEIVEEWRSQSSKGRYESAMWRARVPMGVPELRPRASELRPRASELRAAPGERSPLLAHRARQAPVRLTTTRTWRRTATRRCLSCCHGLGPRRLPATPNSHPGSPACDRHGCRQPRGGRRLKWRQLR